MIDKINISPRIYDTWTNYAKIAVQDILKIYPDIRPEEIPDEDFRILPDGSGEIFIKIRDKEILLKVPKNEFLPV